MIATCSFHLAMPPTQPQTPPPAVPCRRRRPWLELKDGAALVWQHPLLRPVLLTSLAWNLAWFVLQAAYVPHAVKVLGLNAQGVGFTLAAYGVGMVVGALAAPRVLAGWRVGRVITVGPMVSVAASGTLVAACTGRSRGWRRWAACRPSF